MTKPIHDQEFDDYLVDSVSIDEAAITDEYIRVAPDLAYWSAQASEALRDEMLAKAAADEAKAAIKEAEARAWIAAKAALDADQTIKKPTVDQINAHTQIQPILLQARQRHTAAQEHYADTVAARKRVDGVVSAVGTKREMLISLGATLPKEMAGDPPG